MSSKSPFRNAFDDIAGGTVGGVALCLVGHPLDTLKVRLQTQPTDKPLYNGLVDCFRKTVQKEGFSGLYKGVQSPLAGQALFNAWQFFVYGYAQKVILGHDAPAGSRLTIPQYFVVGALTGGLISVIEAPQDLFKSQMQVQVFKEKPSFTSVWGCVRHIWHEGGVRGVYQGLGATVARNIPSVSGYFGVYESMRNYLTPEGGTVADLSSSKLLLAGGLGGLCYWSATYPLDVIKSSMQGDATLKSERKYKNILDCARQLYAQGGSKAFFRGYAPCLLRAFPANAACFFGYEKTRELLSKI